MLIKAISYYGEYPEFWIVREKVEIKLHFSIDILEGGVYSW